MQVILIKKETRRNACLQLIAPQSNFFFLFTFYFESLGTNNKIINCTENILLVFVCFFIICITLTCGFASFRSDDETDLNCCDEISPKAEKKGNDNKKSYKFFVVANLMIRKIMKNWFSTHFYYFSTPWAFISLKLCLWFFIIFVLTIEIVRQIKNKFALRPIELQWIVDSFYVRRGTNRKWITIKIFYFQLRTGWCGYLRHNK